MAPKSLQRLGTELEENEKIFGEKENGVVV
jgi:hypothetical protein